MRKAPLLILLLVWGPHVPGSTASEGVSPALEAARRQPIVEGRAAAGVQLGDREDTVVDRLGGLPLRVETLDRGARRDLVWVADEAADQWTLTIRVTFTAQRDGVQAVHLVIARTPAAPPAYLGATERGYAPGASADLLRATYGSPDATLPVPGRSQVLWWYREHGLVASPGEEALGDRIETRIIVVDQYLGFDEAARLAGGY